ncbi:MAG: hypothetical protein R3C62_16375 [Chloroflexota bacterium]
MDKVKLEIIRSQLERQLLWIERIYENLQERQEYARSAPLIYAESIAYQLHNLYSAIEDLMKLVAKAFENHLEDMSRWHWELIDRMTLEIAGVRPALLQKETAVYLHKLRSFRHFFRHAYTVELDRDELLRNLQTAEAVRPLLRRDVQTFLQQFEE